MNDVLVPAIEGTLAARFEALLKKYGEGLPADIEAFAVQLAGDAAEAIALGRVDLLKELEGALALRMERHRIALVREHNEFVIQVIHELLRFAMQAGAMVAQNLLQNLVAEMVRD